MLRADVHPECAQAEGLGVFAGSILVAAFAVAVFTLDVDLEEEGNFCSDTRARMWGGRGSVSAATSSSEKYFQTRSWIGLKH